ncbi:myelin-associated glycoprotein-like isoform X2 [Astatotilapia calliptera]|uniref:myelin-associated glycoprotein-like isoform X2 n=1 Tax=Astatotilapia calliptera TaxID=8154 RepID=UPI000E410435|nr:myelin-associated glycoprotein-like isoform X2 [Astatotilapia calliptera]
MAKQKIMMGFCLLFAAICSSVSSDEWKATVVKRIDALVGSCVVVPCSFSHTGGNLPSSRLRGIWHEKNDKKSNIYQEDNTLIKDSFKGRTRLVGELGKNNCTLEITEVKDHDNGPFCFRAELVLTENNDPTKDKYSFVEDCVELYMLTEPPKPTVIKPKTATQGEAYTVTCSVIHTCPTHVPKLTWNLDSTKVIVHHKDIKHGNWETQSILTFIPEEKDDNSEITCTAEFNGVLKSPETFTLHVKRVENYNHIIIPSVVGIGTTVAFVLVCIFMTKKYKKRIEELQSRDGSMWNRLSRMSRRSIWSRFSRRPKGDIVDFGHSPNNVNSKSCDNQKVTKPRFPSPKSQPKSYNYKEDPDEGDDYINTADLNIYGNI